MRTKPIKINVRLTAQEHEYLRTRSNAYGGNLSRAFVSLISEANRGPQSPPSLAGVGKTGNPVLSGQEAHRVSQG